MMPSLRFLHATIVHKWHVYCAGRRLGVGRWQLLIHDLSKFRPREFVPYGKFFYAAPGADWLKSSIDNRAKAGLSRAWLDHIQRNPHHWQHWVLINGASVVATKKITSNGVTVEAPALEALPMPRKYVREMLADWMGAGRAYQGEYPKSISEWKWWQENKDQMILHPSSKMWLSDAVIEWFHPAEFAKGSTGLEHIRAVWGDLKTAE